MYQKAVFQKKEYELLLTLEQLSKISKFFNNFENPKELINWLTKSINEKNSNIKINEKECIIQILNPISLKSIDLSINTKKEDLNCRVTNLEEIILKQNKEISFIKEKMNKIEQEYIQQKEKLKKFESIFEEFNQEKRKASFFYDSDILKESEKKNYWDGFLQPQFILHYYLILEMTVIPLNLYQMLY